MAVHGGYFLNLFLGTIMMKKLLFLSLLCMAVGVQAGGVAVSAPLSNESALVGCRNNFMWFFPAISPIKQALKEAMVDSIVRHTQIDPVVSKKMLPIGKDKERVEALQRIGRLQKLMARTELAQKALENFKLKFREYNWDAIKKEWAVKAFNPKTQKALIDTHVADYNKVLDKIFEHDSTLVTAIKDLLTKEGLIKTSVSPLSAAATSGQSQSAVVDAQAGKVVEAAKPSARVVPQHQTQVGTAQFEAAWSMSPVSTPVVTLDQPQGTQVGKEAEAAKLLVPSVSEPRPAVIPQPESNIAELPSALPTAKPTEPSVPSGEGVPASSKEESIN